MKFFFVLVIVSLVCALALSDITKNDDDPSEQIYFITNFDYLLLKQGDEKRNAIIDAWKVCHSFYDIPFDEAIELFQNPLVGDVRVASQRAKCLIDCTQRKTGVLKVDGFKEEQYMLNIKQLLMNHTSFNVDKRSYTAKSKILDTISTRARTLTSYKERESPFATIFYRIPPPLSSLTHENYDLILAYASSVHQCKDLDANDDDGCDTSYIIMRCIMERNREQKFNSPFYPIPVEALKP